MKFSLYDQDDNPLVEGVTHYQYLIRTFEHTKNECPEVHRNIGKARVV